MIRTACWAAALSLLFVLPSIASAQWGGCGGWGGCGPWSGANYYTLDYVPPPPYFSIYPPVYYSPHITARPYGASPYAWPAGYFPTYFTPRVPMIIQPVAPVPAVPASADVVINPYVPGAEAIGKHAGEPQAIENPYLASR